MLISFEDIRKGDRIKVTYTHDDLISSFEGEAYKLTSDGARWVTPSGKGLVLNNTLARIELVERSLPKLPTEPGSVILDVVSVKGVKYGTMFLDYQGDWEAFVIPDKSSFRWLLPSEIKSFRLAKVVPADD